MAIGLSECGRWLSIATERSEILIEALPIIVELNWSLYPGFGV